MTPKPDVRIEQNLHSCTSHSTKSPVGEVKSAKIFPVPRKLPIQFRGRGAGVGGITSAMGLPNRVTHKGCPVRRTRSRVARHVALNLEMGIVSMKTFRPWSTTMVYLWVGVSGRQCRGLAHNLYRIHLSTRGCCIQPHPHDLATTGRAFAEECFDHFHRPRTAQGADHQATLKHPLPLPLLRRPAKFLGQHSPLFTPTHFREYDALAHVAGVAAVGSSAVAALAAGSRQRLAGIPQRFGGACGQSLG